MTLCDVCQEYTLDQFLDEASIEHRLFGELFSTSKDCVLCRLILKTVRQRVAESTQSEEEIEKHLATLNTSRISLRFPALHDTKSPRDRLYIDFNGPRLMIDGWLVLSASDTSLRLIREPGSPQVRDTNIPEGQPLELNAASDSLKKIISGWLEECNQLHKECHESSAVEGEVSGKLPVRVLDLGLPHDRCEPRLLEEHGFSSPYVALSHCWGLSRHIVTDTTNLELHKTRIPYSCLPKTFQDAILLTKSIGIRYLWIDSLCIIQDNIQDWKNEAAKMADVYGNAYCTIAATGSHGDQEGVFIPRAEQDVCNLKYGESNTKILVTSIEDDISALKELHSDSPLSNRAWTLQEKLLSRRIIHFTRSRAIWECRTRFETEDLLVLGPDDFGGILTRNIFEFSTNRSKWLESLKAVGQSRGFSQDQNLACQATFQKPDMALLNFHKLWFNLITDYSRRGLTKGSDKLIALSGVAQEVKEKTGLRYCAGHWLDMVEAGLCWTYGDEPCSRVSPYRAPTWSWVSVDGGITHVTHNRHLEGEPRSNIKLVDSKLVVGNDGQITSGSLVLLGRLKNGTLVPVNAPSGRRICYVLGDKEGGLPRDNNVGEVWLDSTPWWESSGQPPFDIDGKEAQQSHVYQILSLNTRNWHSFNYDRSAQEVLVLEEIEGSSGQYVRVGAGIITVNSWFDDLTQKLISIS